MADEVVPDSQHPECRKELERRSEGTPEAGPDAAELDPNISTQAVFSSFYRNLERSTTHSSEDDESEQGRNLESPAGINTSMGIEGPRNTPPPHTPKSNLLMHLTQPGSNHLLSMPPVPLDFSLDPLRIAPLEYYEEQEEEESPLKKKGRRSRYVAASPGESSGWADCSSLGGAPDYYGQRDGNAPPVDSPVLSASTFNGKPYSGEVRHQRNDLQARYTVGARSFNAGGPLIQQHQSESRTADRPPSVLSAMLVKNVPAKRSATTEQADAKRLRTAGGSLQAAATPEGSCLGGGVLNPLGDIAPQLQRRPRNVIQYGRVTTGAPKPTSPPTRSEARDEALEARREQQDLATQKEERDREQALKDAGRRHEQEKSQQEAAAKLDEQRKQSLVADLKLGNPELFYRCNSKFAEGIDHTDTAKQLRGTMGEARRNFVADSANAELRAKLDTARAAWGAYLVRQRDEYLLRLSLADLMVLHEAL